MKLAYLKGEKVYIEEGSGGLGVGQVQKNYDQVVICKHRDVVRILNSLFKHAEENPENVGPLSSIISAISIYFYWVGNSKEWRLPLEVMNEEELNFDDPQKIKKVREPRLRTDTSNTKNVGNLKVHKGGLYISPSARVPEGLSDKFVNFLKGEKQGAAHGTGLEDIRHDSL